jgi:twitching motility protein PilT
MVRKVNSERAEHIVTIEDPIEFVHQHKKCMVNQREVYSDTHSFKNALKSILRQDPDVVLVGEMRDLETISAALTIAETGHLTLGTLHTNSCAQTINGSSTCSRPASRLRCEPSYRSCSRACSRSS